MFNLVQSLKTLFLYTQSEKDTVEEYVRNFRSLWEMMEAFGGSPGVHQRLVDTELRRRGITNPSDSQAEAAANVAIEQVKAALLISGADRHKFSKLKDKLANDYLLGFGEGGEDSIQLPEHQHPDTLQGEPQRHRGGVPPARGTRRQGRPRGDGRPRS